MEIKMKSNGLPFDVILSAVSDVCYEHSKYCFLNTSKDNLVNILYNSVFDDFNTVLNCIILNNKSISYDIIVSADEKKIIFLIVYLIVIMILFIMKLLMQ